MGRYAPRALLAALGVLLVGCSPAPPDVLPRVVFASPDNIAKVRCPSTPARCVGGRAAYDPISRTIFLPTGWTPESEYDVSTLLHEFVHHLQALGSDKYECIGESETEAYAVQIAWLGSRGHSDPLKVMDINKLALMFATQCRRW